MPPKPKPPPVRVNPSVILGVYGALVSSFATFATVLLAWGALNTKHDLAVQKLDFLERSITDHEVRIRTNERDLYDLKGEIGTIKGNSRRHQHGEETSFDLRPFVPSAGWFATIGVAPGQVRSSDFEDGEVPEPGGLAPTSFGM